MTDRNSSPSQSQRNPAPDRSLALDRNLALELVRVTEAAAISASRLMGRGDNKAVDAAAVDAMRSMLNTVPMDGIVVIGEGEKDDAPMLYNGEKIGDGSPPRCDIAVDPVDGTTLTALGRSNALAVIALADRDSMYQPGPCVYMNKIAVGPNAKGAIDLNLSPTENLHRVAEAASKEVQDLTVVILDRGRHADIIAEVRQVGARVRLIPDGDGPTSQSLVMRSKSGTVRLINTNHRRDKLDQILE